jgi:hypothetical protein
VQDAAKGAVSSKTIDTLRKDAENQKAILAKKGKKATGPTEAVATSMTPHLAMHSTRGVESGRGRREEKKQKAKYQKSVYGNLKLPPDEATPFFTTYVLHYAFPTIAVICTCLGCILLRTMKMYQKERWKGTSYFHGTGAWHVASTPSNGTVTVLRERARARARAREFQRESMEQLRTELTITC